MSGNRLVRVDQFAVEWQNTPDQIKTIYTFCCSFCGAEARETCIGGMTGPPGNPPDWWHMIGFGWVCPSHKVEFTVTVDGKPWDPATKFPHMVTDARYYRGDDQPMRDDPPHWEISGVGRKLR